MKDEKGVRSGVLCGLGELCARVNALGIGDGRGYAAERMHSGFRILDSGIFRAARVNVLTFLQVGGTNCLLEATSLNLLAIGTGWMNPLPPAPVATAWPT